MPEPQKISLDFAYDFVYNKSGDSDVCCYGV